MELARRELLSIDVMLMYGSFVVLSQSVIWETNSRMTKRVICSFTPTVNLPIPLRNILTRSAVSVGRRAHPVVSNCFQNPQWPGQRRFSSKIGRIMFGTLHADSG